MSRRKVVIRAPARLHFGVVNPFNRKYRLYISAGIAIDRPETVVSVYPEEQLSFEGPRSSEVASRLKPLLEEYSLSRGRVVVERCSPKHVGLGSTTQLLLASAQGLLLANGLRVNAVNVAKKIGIGRLSGVGTYVYFHGGFVVDSGKSEHSDFPRLLIRLEVPDSWRFVVLIPSGVGLDEVRESRIFAASKSAPDELIWSASYYLFSGVVPALVEARFEEFSQSLAKLQETVGLMFSEYQGGVFAHHSKTAVEALKGLGVRGVGQSSWGPAVYGAVNSHTEALRIVESVRRSLSDVEAFIACPANRGAEVKLTLE
ncbi:MAG: GHMP kinase [Desulfurococcaceae archaeon]